VAIAPWRPRRVRLRVAAFLAAALPLCGAGFVAVPATSFATWSAASGGDFCTTDEGVTVVVDLTALGGAIVVRCVDGPLRPGYDGWDALSDAGFGPQAPSRVPGFVCRIAGQPTASRSFDIPENSDYHEQCVNTPPASAYWGYWYSDNGGSWTYSTSGASSHRVIEGGFEGWAFSLNSGGHPPRPGIAPDHPTTSTQPPPPTHSPKPGVGSPPPRHPGSGEGGPTTGSPSSSSAAPTGSGPSEQPGGSHVHGDRHDDDNAAAGGKGGKGRGGGPTADPDSSAPTQSASTGDVLVTSDLPTDSSAAESGGSSTSTAIGIGVLALLGLGGGITAWRRSRRA
jgi:hypothetical protein